MSEETGEQYFARREQEELELALTAPNSYLSDAHYARAIEYRTKLKELLRHRLHDEGPDPSG